MQQINLFQPQFRNKTEPFGMQQLLWSVAGFVAILVVLSLYRQWNISTLDSSLQQQKQQLATLNKMLVPLKQSQAAIRKSPLVQKALEKKQNKVNTKQQLIKIMSQRSFGNTEGFTKQLTGLAQQRIEGLWLTALTLRSGGVYMDLQGNSLRPEYLPQYIQRLSNETIFKGSKFDTLVMQRHEKKSGWISFTLNSQEKVNPGEQ
jgi:hypothetical protein